MIKFIFIIVTFIFISIYGHFSYFSVDIDSVGYQKLKDMKALVATNSSGFSIEIGSILFVSTSKTTATSLGRPYELLLENAPVHPNLHLIGHVHATDHFGRSPLISGVSGWSIFNGEPMEELSERDTHIHLHFPTSDNAHNSVNGGRLDDLVLVKQAFNDENFSPERKGVQNEIIREMVGKVSETEWFNNLKRLTAFNRFTTGDQINNARDFIVSTMKSYGYSDIRLENYTIGGTIRWNIIAELKGVENPNDWYFIGGHLDSTSEQSGVNRVCPGAEDDGSGSIAVLEMARVFKQYPPKKGTLKFIWFTGEEQGLVGSTQSASKLVSSGEKDNVKLMLTHDMISYSANPNRIVCLLETSTSFSQLPPLFQAAARDYCSTDFQTAVSFNPFGSDHVPYLNRGMPALLTIDQDYGRYPNYHRSTDKAQAPPIVPKMAVEIMKMDIATVATMMGY